MGDRGAAGDAEAVFNTRLSDLRMFGATSAFQDIVQGKRASRLGTSGSSGGSGSLPDGTASYTQTGLITFDRSSAAPNDEPFHVAAGANKVENLDADLLDGEEATDFHDATQLTGVTDETNGGTGQSTIT
jgi:hypothetical protein